MGLAMLSILSVIDINVDEGLEELPRKPSRMNIILWTYCENKCTGNIIVGMVLSKIMAYKSALYGKVR